MRNAWKTLILPALATVLLAACAGGPSLKNETPEQAVARRAEARWGLMLKQDWPGAYAYLTPGYRELNALDAYAARMGNRRVNWSSAKVGRVKCPAADRCKVQVQIGFSVVGGMPGAPDLQSFGTVDETWLLADGSWYFLPERAG